MILYHLISKTQLEGGIDEGMGVWLQSFSDSLSFENVLPRQSFGNEERDEEMGYYQMGRRLYDPAIGRFMAVDPLFESFPGQSPYNYAFNSPLSWSDPSGLAPEKEKKRDRALGMDMEDFWIGYGILMDAFNAMAKQREAYDAMESLGRFAMREAAAAIIFQNGMAGVP